MVRTRPPEEGKRTIGADPIGHRKTGRLPRPRLRTRVQARIRRHRLDNELILEADLLGNDLHRERARELVGARCRSAIARDLELLLAEASSPPSPGRLSSRAPIARAAIRDCRGYFETLICSLSMPDYISAQGVAMIATLLSDCSSPLYGPDNPVALRRVLEATLDRLENGPTLVG